MDRLEGTRETQGIPQFDQGKVVLLGQQGAHPHAVGGQNHRFAPGTVMPGSNVAGEPTLLKELLNHAQGDPETVGDLGPSALSMVVRRKDSFTEIQRKRSHVQTIPHFPKMATLFIETL
jgi:hypothetical protein